MAESLVESLSDRFKPEDYKDEYRIALQELIEQKMKGEKRAARRRKPEPKVIDLMDALRASIEESRGGEKRAPATKKKESATRSRRRKSRAA